MDILVKRTGESTLYDVDCTLELGASETISSVTSVANDPISGVTDLTITGKTVNTSTVDYDWGTAAIGKVIQFRVAGGVAGYVYTIRIVYVTNESNIKEAVVRLNVTDE